MNSIHLAIMRTLRKFDKPIPIGFLAEQVNRSYTDVCNAINRLKIGKIPIIIDGNSVYLKEDR